MQTLISQLAWFIQFSTSREYLILCSFIPVYARNKSRLLHCYLLPTSSQATLSATVSVILSAVIMAVQYSVGTGWCCGQGRVMRCYLLADAGQHCLAFLCLMRSVVDTPIHGFLTEAFNIARSTS